MNTQTGDLRGGFRDGEMVEPAPVEAMVQRGAVMGLWAASRLGLMGFSALTYALDVASLASEGADDNAIVAKVINDFRGHGIPIAEHSLHSKFRRMEK